jgi:hypothetical protein
MDEAATTEALCFGSASERSLSNATASTTSILTGERDQGLIATNDLPSTTTNSG